MIQRRRITAFIAVVISFAMAAAAAWSQDDALSTSSGISAERIENALEELTADGTYEYEESALDEPAWLMALREWFGNLGRRWDGSPINFLNRGGFQLFGTLLVLILAMLVLVFILMRLFGRGYRPGIEGRAFEQGPESMGAWGDAGIKKAGELASAGNYREAVSVLFRASLKGLDNLGWIKYRTSSASRQYLRQLRRSNELYPIFRDFLQRFEVAYYRKDTPDSDDWSFLHDKYHSLAAAAASVRPPLYMQRRMG